MITKLRNLSHTPVLSRFWRPLSVFSYNQN